MDCGLDYSKAEGLFSKSVGTVGSILENFWGSFAKRSAKSVSTDLSRRIDDGRCRIDREGRGHRSGAERGGTMAGTSELAGVVGSRPMGYGFTRE